MLVGCTWGVIPNIKDLLVAAESAALRAASRACRAAPAPGITRARARGTPDTGWPPCKCRWEGERQILRASAFTRAANATQAWWPKASFGPSASLESRTLIVFGAACTSMQLPPLLPL